MSMSDQIAVLTVLSVTLAVAVVGLVAATIVLALRVRRLATDQRRAFEGGEVDVIAALARQRRRIEEVGDALDAARAHSLLVEAKADRSLSRIGVVRYDAFDDIGGELSFSVAMLDEHVDGVVLTSITGRTGGRSYLKAVTAGEGANPLSEEESAAVAAARGQQRVEQVVGQGKRRWRQR